MTKTELERLRVLQAVQRGFRRQRDAATELGISERHLRRLLRGLEAEAAASVPSKKRGKPPNNGINESVRAHILTSTAQVRPADVPIVSSETTRVNRSFGNGQARYAPVAVQA